MAVIKFTNSKSTLKHIINYITQDAKTTTELITGKDCTSDNALEEMQTVKNLYNKTTGRQYIHLVQSFSPNDNLSYAKAHEIGLELAKQYKGFQVLVATHTDREHVHNHLVINSVSFKDGKKFQQSKKDMEKIKIYSNEDVEVINEVQNANNIQILKEDLKVNSLIGQGNTKISAKDNIPIDAMDNLAEILKCNINMVNKDIKTSYNKVLTKSEVEVKIIYLTEDNRINTITSRIPVVGFIDIPNVMDENTCDINYEIKNVIIKPNSQEEHSICVEVEIEVTCSVYEEKNLNLIQDMYSPCENIEFNKKEVLAMTDKQESKCTKQINEKINLKDIQNQTLIDVDIEPTILKESKINTKILYEGELNLNFIFVNSEMKISIKDAKIPFEYTVENLQNGESLQTNNQIEIKQKDFIIQDSGDVQCNIDMETDTNMYRTANINIIDSVQENGEREEQDYSIVMYIVKKGDTLWNIAKMFGSTVDSIARVNGIENPDEINIGQKLFIPKFSRVPVTNYE